MIRWIIFLLIVVVLFFVVVMIIDCNRFIVREYQIRTDKIAKNSRLLMISDLHNKEFGKKNERLLETIEALKPDAILLAGDILTAHKGAPLEPALNFVKNINKKYPIYYGEGNHEFRLRLYPEDYGDMGERYEKALNNFDVNILRNERVSVPQIGLDIVGLSIDKEHYKRFKKLYLDPDFINESIGRANDSQFQILIAHNPQYAESYVKWGADLTVCGHVHGGLMKLPILGGVISPNLTLFPKYDGGRFDFGEKTVIVGRGLGTHTLPIRIFNPGELVVIELEKK